MNSKVEYHCLDEHCRTVLIEKNKDGVRCPRCHGPVVPKPFEHKRAKVSDRGLFVRRTIMDRDLEECKVLTPEQVDTILAIGDEYPGNAKKEQFVTIEAGETVLPLKCEIDLEKIARALYKELHKSGRNKGISF